MFRHENWNLHYQFICGSLLVVEKFRRHMEIRTACDVMKLDVFSSKIECHCSHFVFVLVFLCENRRGTFVCFVKKSLVSLFAFVHVLCF